MNIFRTLLWIQGGYSLLTAIWPLIHIESFMWVTGPKTDIWLVKTVGVLIGCTAITMLMHLFIKTNHWPVAILASTTAAGLAFIDIYYAFNDVISNIYLLDAVAELIFLGIWILIMLRWKKQKNLSITEY